MPQIDLH